VHLPERSDTCDVVARRETWTARRAVEEFADRQICRDCARGETRADTDSSVESRDLKP
jgi:hypothetical protein